MNMQTSIDTRAPLVPPPPRKRSRRRLFVTAAALVLIGAGVAGWHYGRPHSVPAEVVRPGTLEVEVKGPGTLTALTEATLSSRIQARIETLSVDRNDVVTAGQGVARLASDDLAADLAAAKAGADASERAIRAAEADRDHADAVLDKARAAHSRQQALFARGVTSAAGRDDALAALRQAEADRVRADRSIEKAEAERAAAAAQIARARTRLDDSVLTAPIAGVVVSRAHQTGDLLNAGSELLHIVDPAGLVLTARLDESVIDRVRPGLPARVHFGDAAAIPGHVLRLGREVDVETREFELDIVLDRLPENWALGQRGTAHITLAELRNVLTVPRPFLTRRDGRPGLWVAAAGRARWRPVTPGAGGAERVEIRAGLVPGDTVLAPDGVFAMMRVRPLEGQP